MVWWDCENWNDLYHQNFSLFSWNHADNHITTQITSLVFFAPQYNAWVSGPSSPSNPPNDKQFSRRLSVILSASSSLFNLNNIHQFGSPWSQDYRPVHKIRWPLSDLWRIWIRGPLRTTKGTPENPPLWKIPHCAGASRELARWSPIGWLPGDYGYI